MIASGMAAQGLALPAPALAAEAPAKKKGGGLNYIQFETLTATVIRPNGRRGVMTVDSGVDVPDAGLRQRATLSTPRLQAAYVQWLTAYAASLAPGQPPDADYMSTSLQRQTDLILGRPGAHLLLGAILIN
ncbi:MAG: Tat pathway signal protein [Caulobacteraceae bacterium]|nr:Tat pathway signal protein [Caulobacteraceae bacterium]